MPRAHFFRQVVRARETWTCLARRRESFRRYNKSEKGAARYRHYDHSPGGSARFIAYNATDKGRAKFARYSLTDKGRAAAFVHDLKRGHV